MRRLLTRRRARSAHVIGDKREADLAARLLHPPGRCGVLAPALCVQTLGGFCLLAQLEDCDIGIIHMVYVAKKRRGSSRKKRAFGPY